MLYLSSIWKKEETTQATDKELASIMNYRKKCDGKLGSEMSTDGRVFGWAFPVQLNSFERLKVHSIAEELGLAKRKVGEKEDGTRQILLFCATDIVTPDLVLPLSTIPPPIHMDH